MVYHWRAPGVGAGRLWVGLWVPGHAGLADRAEGREVDHAGGRAGGRGGRHVAQGEGPVAEVRVR